MKKMVLGDPHSLFPDCAGGKAGLAPAAVPLVWWCVGSV